MEVICRHGIGESAWRLFRAVQETRLRASAFCALILRGQGDEYKQSTVALDAKDPCDLRVICLLTSFQFAGASTG
jgi:hypothetical protein